MLGRFCRKCRVFKVAAEFSSGPAYKGGIRSRCRKCDSKRRKARRSAQTRCMTRGRSRLWVIIHDNIDGPKSREMLGCTRKEFMDHIESQFKDGMTWDNNSVHGWHLDHIIPLDAFDLTKLEEFNKAFHYTNTRPVWAKENWSKGTKIVLTNVET